MGTPNRLAAHPVLLILIAVGVTVAVLTLAGDNQPANTHPPVERQVGPSEVVPPDLAALLAPVLPGMPAQHVAEVLRPLPTGEYEPLDLDAGHSLYRVRYRGFLHAPVPHLAPPIDFVPGPHVVTLVFDAGLPDHPLVFAEVTPASPGTK